MSAAAIDRARHLVALDCATCGCDWSGEACRESLSRDDVRALLAAIDANQREVERLHALPVCVDCGRTSAAEAVDALRANARRRALEEAAGRVAKLVVGRWRASDLDVVCRCILRMIGAPPDRDAGMVDAIRADDVQARRAALEEAIEACEERAVHNRGLARTLLRDHLTSRAEGADECIEDLRALLDTPRTDPVRPAPEPPCTCLSDAGWGSPRRSCERHP